MFKTLLVLPLILCICILGSTLARAQKPSPNEKNANIEGRWNIVFQLPNGSFHTPIEFTTAQNDRVEWVVLGPTGAFRIKPTKGQLTGKTVNLEADSSWGKLKVNATIEGDGLQGKWSPFGFIARRFVSGKVEGSRDRTNRSGLSNVELFDTVWKMIESRFYNPQFNGVDWQAARFRYRLQIEAARSTGQAVTVIRQMLEELRSSHLEFLAIPERQSAQSSGGSSPGSSPPPAVNWRRLSPTVGYLQILRFEDGEQNLELIDRAFAELGDLASLIIDIRGNPGGSLGIAMRVGDYLFPASTPIGYFVNRLGLEKYGVKSIDQIDFSRLSTYSGYDLQSFKTELNRSGGVSLVTGGRSQSQYSGRVVLLIDDKSHSTSEAFAGVMKDLGAGTLIGRRTGGKMLGADYFPLNGGWLLTIPVRDFRTPKGSVIEGRGVQPDVSVKPEKKGDPELTSALKFLRKNSGGN